MFFFNCIYTGKKYPAGTRILDIRVKDDGLTSKLSAKESEAQKVSITKQVENLHKKVVYGKKSLLIKKHLVLQV